jgi:replicative DNA helicase
MNAPDHLQRSIKDLVFGALNKIEDFHKRAGLPGLSTGFPHIDQMTGGLRGGEMLVIGSRPGVGKTALSANIAEHVAVEQKLPVGIITLEMSAEAYVLRMVCSRARVNLRNFRDGLVAERDFPKLTGSCGRIAAAPFIVEAVARLSTGELHEKATQMHSEFGAQLLIIDYLQLLSADPGAPVQSREQEMTVVAHAIKALAIELNLPIIVLSQLNRDLHRSDSGREPRLSDLRESGAIEDAADVVMLLYQPEPDDDYSNTEIVASTLLIAKQRSGPVGRISLTFFPGFARFESAAPSIPDDSSPLGTNSVLDIVTNAWQNAVNPEFLSHSSIAGLNKHGTLFIQMDQHWLDIAVQKYGQILERLKNCLGGHVDLVQKISFRRRPE